MKKLLIIGILLFGLGWYARAQTLSAPAHGVTSVQTVATCPAPAVGMTWYCETFTGRVASYNGAAYIPDSAGVTSVTANGVKQTGDVVLPPIPIKVSITSTGVLQ